MTFPDLSSLRRIFWQIVPICAMSWLFQVNTLAQVPYTFQVDVHTGLQNGQIIASHSPLDIGSISAAFDGIMSPGNLARSAGINPLVVTLQFPYNFNITATGIYTPNTESGLWSVEAAGTMTELDHQSGTYLKLIDQAPYTDQSAVTYPVSATGRVLRLTMHRLTGDSYVHLGEWKITATATIQATGLCMKPNSVRLIPDASFKPDWFVTADNGAEVPISAELNWQSSNSNVVTVDNSGVFSAGANLGESIVTTSWHGLSKETNVKVVADFKSPTAEPRVVKVALIIMDPPIPAAGGQRFSERFWPFNGGPMALARQTRDSIFSVSGGVVDYQFVEMHDEPNLLTKFGGTQLSVDSMYKLFLEPGWPTLHNVAETLGQSEFQYNELLNKYDICNKSNNHGIDEVWVWAMPFIGMWESNMTGTGAFWINGGVVTDNTCTDLLPIMGFNYERNAGCALHNFTHRIETTMYRLFGSPVRYVQSDPPYPAGVQKNPLQTFMLYDQLEPGNAHIGNSHFPPNGVDNYDYDNPASVLTHAPNWKRYPYLFDETAPVDCSAWGCEGDCGLNFSSWWMRYIPHFRCKDQAGRLNNWWPYVIDFNEGLALAAQTDGCGCKMFDDEISDCVSKGAFPWHEWISRVHINDLNHSSGKSEYSDFTGTALHVIAGETYSVSLSAGFSYYTWDEYFRVWLDLNNDGIFEDSEKIAEGTLPKPADGTPEATLNLQNALPIPGNAGPAQHLKMRVSMKRGAYPTPCETIPFGEVEDYSVNIAPSVQNQPNLQVFNWTLIASAAPGQTRNSTLDVFNAGTVPVAASFPVGIFLSTDNLWGPNDLLLSSLSLQNLDAGAFSAQSLAFTIPLNTTPGNYFLILRVDYPNLVAETNESDNTIVSTFFVQTATIGYCQSQSNFPWHDWIAQITMKNLDYASGKSQYSDFTTQTVHVNGGFPVQISLGAGFSYFTYDEYWKVWIDYNQNGIFEEDNETFVSLMVPKPADGTPFYSATTTAFILGGFTQDITTRMRVAMKRGGYPSACEQFAFGEVEDYTIHIAPGGGNSRPDLSLVNLLAVSSGLQGTVVPFTFDLKNSGTANASGDYTIGAYLSADSQLDANDALVGTVQTGNTPIGTIPNVQGAFAVPLNLTSGSYFFILKADINNTIQEFDELNNLISRPFTVLAAPGGADLELTISGNQTHPAIYSNFTVTLHAKNAGTQIIQFAKIAVGVCESGTQYGFTQPFGLVYAGTPPPPATGTYDAVSQSWTLSNLLPGQTAQLNLPLFTLTATERELIAFSYEQSPGDPDSQPGACPANCIPMQDDEAVFTINSGQQHVPDAPDRAVQPAPSHILRVFPNPSSGVIFLNLAPWPNQPITVSLYNPLALKVLEKQLDDIQGYPVQIDLLGFASGTYFLKVEIPGERSCFGKVVVAGKD